MTTAGLHRLPSEELKRLLRALHRGALPSPVTRWALIEKGFGNIELHLAHVVGRDVESAKAMLVAVLAERATGGGATSVDLVHCGLPSAGTRSRDTLEQVRELLTSATQSVELYGLRTQQTERGLVRTAAAVCDGRDVHGRLVFDTDGSEQALGQVRDIVRANFRRLEKIEVWSNPPSLRLALRAVIVDKVRALVTSGELDGGEDDRFVTLGALLHDATYISAWHKEWDLLTRSGTGPAALVRVDLR
jgi:hypothetical protein